MSDARSKLLERVMEEAGNNGLVDRSLREMAAAVGSSHRMLIFHFGSRAGLVAAVVEAVETAQRELLSELADQVTSPSELVLLLWQHVSSPELRPFVRLFFDCVALSDGDDLTDSWLDVAQVVTDKLEVAVDEVELRMGVAVTRGLLIDVLTTGDAEQATKSIERFVEIWNPGGVATGR